MSRSLEARTRAELKDMFTLGRDMPAQRWLERLRADEAYAALARRLLWQTDGRRYVIEEDAFRGYDSALITPSGPVSLAHPVELDADEILFWRDLLTRRAIRQPFRQIWESVVLQGGRLTENTCAVRSAGEEYQMSDRYRSYVLPLAMIDKLKEEGFRFIARHRWDARKNRFEEIELVNIVTPAGILYECKPNMRMDSLDGKNGGLVLNLFYPFEGVGMRTVNHTAAVLEDLLLEQFAARDDVAMLLPHLPGLAPQRLRMLRGHCKKTYRSAALLDRLIARKEGRLC